MSFQKHRKSAFEKLKEHCLPIEDAKISSSNSFFSSSSSFSFFEKCLNFFQSYYLTSHLLSPQWVFFDVLYCLLGKNFTNITYISNSH